MSISEIVLLYCWGSRACIRNCVVRRHPAGWGGGKEGKEGEGMKREKEVKVGEEKEEMEERYIVKDTFKIGKESLNTVKCWHW